MFFFAFAGLQQGIGYFARLKGLRFKSEEFIPLWTRVLRQIEKKIQPVSMINKRAGYAADPELRLYEINRLNNTIVPMPNYDNTIELALDGLTHGFVVIFEKKDDNTNDFWFLHQITFVE
jgi:hypothetical protein